MFVKHFIQDLQNDAFKHLQIGRLRHIKTRYFNYMDSHVENGDFVWGIGENDEHFANYVDTIWKIKGLNLWRHCNQLKQFANVSSIVIICGYQVNILNTHVFYNMENYTFDDLPDYTINFKVQHVTSASNIIQKLYCAHSHCIMTLSDHQKISNFLSRHSKDYPKWPFITDTCINKIPKHRQREKCNQINSRQYCGWYAMCRQHSRMGCCDMSDGIKLEGFCTVEEDPVFKLYSIYQGFIPRFFSTTKISEL